MSRLSNGGAIGKVLQSEGFATITHLGTIVDTNYGNVEVNISLSSLNLAKDDILVVFSAAHSYSSAQVATPTGHTSEEFIQYNTGGTGAHASRMTYKIMGSTPDTNVNYSSGYYGVCIIYAFRGVDTSTPFDVTTESKFGANTIAPEPITPVTEGAMVISSHGSIAFAYVPYNTWPDMDQFSTGAINSSSASSLAAAFYSGWTSGSFQPGTPTLSTSSYNGTTITAALRPKKAGSGIWGPQNGSVIGKQLALKDNTIIADPISYVGGNDLGYAGTTSAINHSISSISMQENDLVIALFIANTGSFTSTATGYTTIASVYANDTNDVNFWVGYKFMGSTPDTSIAFPNGTTNTSDAGAVVVHVYRGVNTTTPIDVTTQTDVNTNTVYPTIPSITPSTDGAVIVMAAGGGHGSGVDTFSASGVTDLLSAGGTDTYDATAMMCNYKDWVSGAYTPPSVTFTGTDSTSYAAAAATFVLRPNADVFISKDSLFRKNFIGGSIGGVPSYESISPIELVGSASWSGNTVSAINISLSGIPMQENDIVMYILNESDSFAQLGSTATGYTSLGSGYKNDNFDSNCSTGYKFMGATPDANITFSDGTNGYGGTIYVKVYRGVDTTTPLDVSVTSDGDWNTALISPTNITPVTKGAVILVFHAASHGNGDTPLHAIGNMNEFEAIGYNGGSDSMVAMAANYDWVSGAYDPGEPEWVKSDNDGYSSHTFTIALRPNGTHSNSGIWFR